MFGKMFNFNLFSSEKKQRGFEKQNQTLVERSKLEHGNLLLFKTALAEYSTLCAFVKVTDLSLFISDLFNQAQAESCQDLTSMKNLNHPLFNGKLWVIISGDKGSQTMKYGVGLGGHDVHLFGLFEASDTPSNMLTFQSNYIEQIRKLVAFGVSVTAEDGGSKNFQVEVFVTGDKAFLYDQNGHAGAAATYPSIYNYVKSSHLRKQHLDGSSHTLSNPSCRFKDREPDELERDYHENVTDRRVGTVRTRGKNHNSIVGPRLMPLKSQMNFAISSLHIGLGIILRVVGYMEVDDDILDGIKI